MKDPIDPRYVKVAWFLVCLAAVSALLEFATGRLHLHEVPDRSERMHVMATLLLGVIAFAQLYRCHLWELVVKKRDDA